MSRLVLAALLAASPLLARSARAQEESADMPPPPPPPDDAEASAPPPPADAQPPARPPSQQTFEQQLSPYGRWVDTPEYGRVWIPSGVGADWQPYADGRWVDTAYGWTFVSTVPWGPVVFHYGRWGWRAGFGWYWIPGFRWGPAWVQWRWVNGYACWSPLAPRGFVYGRYWPGWVAVPHTHFTAPIRRWVVPRAQLGAIVRSSRPVRAFPSYRANSKQGRGSGGHHGGRDVRR
jgi:hypothetical protein